MAQRLGKSHNRVVYIDLESLRLPPEWSYRGVARPAAGDLADMRRGKRKFDSSRLQSAIQRGITKSRERKGERHPRGITVLGGRKHLHWHFDGRLAL